MPDAAPAKPTIDPPIAAWRLGEPSPKSGDVRTELAPLLDTLGLHDTRFDPARPVVATGHQAWFWHPGILAKDLAMAVACERLDAQPIHLVVDHVANPALTIDVPVRRGDALAAEPLRLGQEDLSLGTGRRPPLSSAALRDAVACFERGLAGEVLADLSALLDLPAGFEALGSLADSITAMQLHQARRACPGVFILRTSSLARLPTFAALADRMLHDARRCVAAYNDAAARFPEADIAPLTAERDRAELPLWLLDAGGGLGRVYADLADSTPLLTGEDGTPIRPVTAEGVEHLALAPRALTLTAFMRSALCDLFIHGLGGGVYEQVTERWWRQWVGGSLAPLAVVSADVTLEVEVPVATREALGRAMWFRHHLPHNIDRYADAATLDPALLAEKRAIIEGNSADHDKPARLAARRRLKAINTAFAQAHPGLLADADAAVARVRQGVANAAVADRRDWCFALYPPGPLAELRQRLVDSA